MNRAKSYIVLHVLCLIKFPSYTFCKMSLTTDIINLIR